jgi:hypothetical protein
MRTHRVNAQALTEPIQPHEPVCLPSAAETRVLGMKLCHGAEV